ncbi:MAG TPA: hypothetical protein VJ736_08705 [Actinomycetota bacterium]|nr:hypothetical protein [Actinomycetota bacterium]
MLFFPVVCASVWCAISLEMVWETARTQGRALVLFGHVVAAPSVSSTIVICCAVSAAAALAMAIAVGYARGRRLERRMAAELDARWAELAERDAGDAARRELLNWRLAELQTLVDRLLADRQAATDSKERHLVVVPDADLSTPTRG